MTRQSSAAEDLSAGSTPLMELRTQRPANDESPQSGVGLAEVDRNEDVDIKEEVGVDPTRAVQNEKVAATMDWKTLPQGALARIKWDSKKREVEVIKSKGLTASHTRVIEIVTRNIKLAALAHAWKDREDRGIVRDTVTTVW